jgi:hypothetical protein
MKIRGWAVSNRKLEERERMRLGVFAYVDVGGK